MLTNAAIPILLALAVCLVLLSLARGGTRGGSVFRASDYRSKTLLSAWEIKALCELQNDLPPDLHACPQVRLADMLHVNVTDPAKHRAALNRVASKSVDFAIVDKWGRVALVIELDDKSHNRPDRRERDRIVDAALQYCGIPVLRVRPGNRINARAHLGPGPDQAAGLRVRSI